MALNYHTIAKLKSAFEEKLEREQQFEFSIVRSVEEQERLMNIQDDHHRVVFYIGE